MEQTKKQQLEMITNKIVNDEEIINKLITYLKQNNLLEDLYSKIYYSIEKGEPICKIKYYKSKVNGMLLNMSDVKNNYDLLKDYLEDYIVYMYDEIKTWFFAGKELGKELNRNHEYCKSYNNLDIKYSFLDLDKDKEQIELTKIIKQNPILFIYVILNYNIKIDELNNINEKGYTYKKEIKKN